LLSSSPVVAVAVVVRRSRGTYTYTARAACSCASVPPRTHGGVTHEQAAKRKKESGKRGSSPAECTATRDRKREVRKPRAHEPTPSKSRFYARSCQVLYLHPCRPHGQPGSCDAFEAGGPSMPALLHILHHLPPSYPAAPRPSYLPSAIHAPRLCPLGPAPCPPVNAL